MRTGTTSNAEEASVNLRLEAKWVILSGPWFESSALPLVLEGLKIGSLLKSREIWLLIRDWLNRDRLSCDRAQVSVIHWRGIALEHYF